MSARTTQHRMTQRQWRRATEWPLTVAALVFLVAYAWQVLADLEAPDDTVPVAITWVVWALFLVDYLVNLALAERRGHWFVTHLLEFLVVILPILRPLRLLRLVSLLTILQRAAGDSLRGRVVVYATGATTLLVVLAGLAVLDVERDADGAKITTYSDALWWAVSTLTSVGYGDEVPITGEGRLIGVAVMLAGLALLGTVTATLASLLLDRLSESSDRSAEQSAAASRADIAALSREVRALRQELGFRAEPPGEHPAAVLPSAVQGAGVQGSSVQGSGVQSSSGHSPRSGADLDDHPR